MTAIATLLAGVGPHRLSRVFLEHESVTCYSVRRRLRSSLEPATSS